MACVFSLENIDVCSDRPENRVDPAKKPNKLPIKNVDHAPRMEWNGAMAIKQ